MGLHARTGLVRWETQAAHYEQGYSYTSGPTVADGKVITGLGSFLTPEIVSPDGHNALYVFRLGGL